jgi:transposase-like protein
MELQVGKRYLIDSITYERATSYDFQCIKCVENTETAIKIEYETGETKWLRKETTKINVVEELQDKEIRYVCPNCGYPFPYLYGNKGGHCEDCGNEW